MSGTLQVRLTDDELQKLVERKMQPGEPAAVIEAIRKDVSAFLEWFCHPDRADGDLTQEEEETLVAFAYWKLYGENHA